MIRRSFLALCTVFALSGLALAEPNPHRAEAVFAGGCFWSAEHDMEQAPGVIDAISGYTGGRTRNPTYEDVATETTGHYESVRVIYDPARITYRQLTDYFLRHIDPTDPNGQFCDRGPSYRTAIFVTPGQRADAEAAIADARRILGRPITTRALPLGPFYQAEGYHQNFARLNPDRYFPYRRACGRDQRIAETWRGR